MNPTVFVTGAGGFLGSALCPYLEAHGYDVRRGVEPGRDTVPPDPENQGNVFAVDIGPTTDWHTPLDRVDAVIHLAARVHVMRETERDPLVAFRRVNTDGTKQLALSAAERGVRRFVFVSTVGVHGASTPVDKPFTETSPAAPHSAYTRSKWEAEQALRQIAQDTGLEVVIVRPPLVYGPGVPGNFLRLLKLANSGFPLPLGSINNRRSFVSRTNLVSFLQACIEHPRAPGEAFLISDGEDVSTTGLVQKIAHHLSRPTCLFPCPPSLIKLTGHVLRKKHTVEQLWGSLMIDSGKARELLDWKPPVSMDEELDLTAAWFKRQWGK